MKYSDQRTKPNKARPKPCLCASDALFPHPAAKRAGVDTQHGCRAFFTLYPPSGLLQRLDDVLAFDIDEGLAVLLPFFAGLQGVYEPVQDLQAGALARD